MIGGGSWIIGSRLFIILCFFPQIIHFKFFRDIHYSFFWFFKFLYQFSFPRFSTMQFVYQKFTVQYTFNLIFNKYYSIFSINVVKIMLSFSINRPSMQLLQREGPNSSLTTLRTKTEYIYMYIYISIFFFCW